MKISKDSCNHQRNLAFSIFFIVGLLIGLEKVELQADITENNSIKVQIEAQKKMIEKLNSEYENGEIDYSRYLKSKRKYDIELRKLEGIPLEDAQSTDTPTLTIPTIPPFTTPSTPSSLPIKKDTQPVVEKKIPSAGKETLKRNIERLENKEDATDDKTTKTSFISVIVNITNNKVSIGGIIVIILAIVVGFRRRPHQTKGPKNQSPPSEESVEQKHQTNQGKFIQVFIKDSFELSETFLQIIKQESTPKLKDYLKTKGKSRMILVVMFTDLEGSTELTNRFGDAWWDKTREKVDTIALPIIEKSGFYVKNIGDSYMAAFESASNGVEAAINLQKALADFNRNRPDEPDLKMRIGLHSGEVTLKRDDFFGTNVNIASRIEHKASGGQIFVSEQVYKDAKSYKEISAVKIGSCKIKGIGEEITVYEILWQKN